MHLTAGHYASSGSCSGSGKAPAEFCRMPGHRERCHKAEQGLRRQEQTAEALRGLELVGAGAGGLTHLPRKLGLPLRVCEMTGEGHATERTGQVGSGSKFWPLSRRMKSKVPHHLPE